MTAPRLTLAVPEPHARLRAFLSAAIVCAVLGSAVFGVGLLLAKLAGATVLAW